MVLRVGELARRTGLTVRTLHHYDEIGLLRPARRSFAVSGAGYRLYGPAEVERLTRIVLLKRLGLSLDEIRSGLDEPALSLARTLELQIVRLREEIDGSTRLLRRLEALAARLGGAADVPAEDLMETLEGIAMYEKHFTPEQLRQLEERAAAVGAERIAEVEAEWPRLIAEVRAAMARGVDPASDEAAGLAARWMGLVAEFTGGDAGIARSVGRLYKEESAMRQKTGLDSEIMGWIQRADAARRAPPAPPAAAG
jgi:DNA-binding transcriptional MerR regulator